MLLTQLKKTAVRCSTKVTSKIGDDTVTVKLAADIKPVAKSLISAAKRLGITVRVRNKLHDTKIQVPPGPDAENWMREIVGGNEG